LLFGGMALAIAVFGYAFYQEEVKIERQHIMTRDLHHVELQQAILTDALTNAFDALAFIAGQVRPHRPFSYPEGRRQLGADFISFLRTIPALDQVRLLDMQGREFIRANQTRAGPRLVPDAELQNKSGRDRGQFEEGGDLFSFAAFDPLQALKDLPGFSAGDDINRHRWITVSRVSASTFARTMAPERRQYLSGTAILMLVAALLAGILAWLHT